MSEATRAAGTGGKTSLPRRKEAAGCAAARAIDEPGEVGSGGALVKELEELLVLRHDPDVARVEAHRNQAGDEGDLPGAEDEELQGRRRLSARILGRREAGAREMARHV